MSFQYTSYERPSMGFGGTITWAVQRLILINVVVFAVQLVVEIPLGYNPFVLQAAHPPGGWLVDWLMFDSSRIWAVWTLGTYMFLHGGLLHLVSNMIGLYFFGPEVERTLGSRQFVSLYLASGALGVLGDFLLSPLYGAHVIVGASGAVMGVLVAFAVIAPNQQIFLFPIPFPLTIRGLAIIYIFMNLLAPLGVAGGNQSWATHLGGMAVGFAFVKAIPVFRRWELERDKRRMAKPKKQRSAKKGEDPVGEAVDNIFKFEERDRRK